jgi:20S proteasome alpha/beta subunit
MTLIIALACKDGIVMASDGQVTASSAGGPIRIPGQKIYQVTDNVLFGASGSLGVIQRAYQVVKSLESVLNNDWGSMEVREGVRRSLFEIYKNELDRHREFYKGTPYEDIRHAPPADILLCKYREGIDGTVERRIWHIAMDCSDEFLDELGYGCTGIGDVFAHTLLRRYPVKDLDVERGKLIAYRVLKEAMEVGAYGLGEPIDIWVISKQGVRRLKRGELEALEDTYSAWRRVEMEIFERI